MSDQTTGAAAPNDATTDPTDANAKPDTGADVTAELDKWKHLSREHESKAKAALKELDTLRKQSMSDQERAVADAHAAGRAEALAAVTGKLVGAEIRAQAAGRLDDARLAVLLDDLKLDAYVDADGDVDVKRISKLIDAVAPAAAASASEPARPAPLDLGQGARTAATPLNGDQLLNALKAKLGA